MDAAPPFAKDAGFRLLLTDLYEIDMLHAYLDAGMTESLNAAQRDS